MPSKVLWISGVMLAALAAAASQNEGGPTLTDVQVHRFEIRDAGAESVTIAVSLAATAQKSASLRSLAFDDVTINGVRVTVPPVSGPVTLRSGQPLEGLPPLVARLAFRDLESMEPLRRAVVERQARIKAVVRAQLQLSLFQKMMLLGEEAWIAAPLDQAVPVEVPGGMLGRAAAAAALLAAEPVWAFGRAGIEYRRSQSEFTRNVRERLAGSIYLIETRYTLVSRDGETAAVRRRAVGFLVSGHGLLAPAESVEPWMFDPVVSEAMERKEVSVREDDFEITATGAMRPAGQRTFSLRQGTLRIRKKLNGGGTALSLADHKRYKLRIRAHDSNAALFDLADAESAPGQGARAGLPAAENGHKHGEPPTEWREAAVVRIRPGFEAEILLTPARLENGRIRLDNPVDASAYGSPVWVEGGVAGFVQDQDSGARLPDVLKKLR